MTNRQQARSDAKLASQSHVRVAVWCAYASGVVSIFGIAFLVAFFTTFIGPLGTLNDAAVVIQYVLMVPMAVALHQILHRFGITASPVVLLLGILGMLAVIALQLLFMAGVLQYAQYIVPVSAGFLVVLGWFLMVRRLGYPTGAIPASLTLNILAGLYVGYPVWAFSLGRRLREAGTEGVGRGAV